MVELDCAGIGIKVVEEKPYPRKLDDWIEHLLIYAEDTESPRSFWRWCGIFTIAATLQRNVRIEFGMEHIYPNLYIFLVGPPGARKGLPIKIAKKFLREVGRPIALDSQTKRSMTKELYQAGVENYINLYGEMEKVSAMNYVSSELGSLLAHEIKDLTTLLTDLWDSHDKWDYGTAGSGRDWLYNITLNIFAATNPGWLTSTMPRASVDGGLIARVILVYGDEKYKELSLPPIPDVETYHDLLFDLQQIAKLRGTFEISNEAYQEYDTWYNSLGKRLRYETDQRIIYNLDRLHVNMLKVAMCLSVAESNQLRVELPHVVQAISLVDGCLEKAPKAFGAMGRNENAVTLDRIRNQIKQRKSIKVSELLKLNWVEASKAQIMECVDTLKTMQEIVVDISINGTNHTVRWTGKEK